jgi:hypothetical protein
MNPITDGTRKPLHAPLKDLVDAGETLAAYLSPPVLGRREKPDTVMPLVPQRSSVKPIERVLQLLAELRQEFRRALKDECLSRQETKRRDAKFERKRKQFNALFASLGPQTRNLRLEGFDIDGEPIFDEGPPFDPRADLLRMYLAGRLAKLAKAGSINRLRRCARCGAWFFAGKPWAKFHSRGCKKAAELTARQTEKFNKYQSDYYRKWLSQNSDLYEKGYSPAEVRQLLRDPKLARAARSSRTNHK